MARGGNLLRHLEPHLPYGYQGKNATFWSRSLLTPLIAWKTQTNIGKHFCISQCPTRDPKRTKMELLDHFFASRSDQECLKNQFFWIFSHSLYPTAPETCRNKLAHQNTSLGAQGVPFLDNGIRF